MKLTASYPWLYCDRGLYSKGIAMDIDENCPEFQEYIKQNYEDHDGKLFNKKRQAYTGNIKRFNECGNEYRGVKICNRKFLVHRIIWFLHYGSFPKDMIDHIDRDGTNNKISNLREATNSQNQHNVTKKIINSSGYKNVFWDKKDNLYKVKIRNNSKFKYYGCFKKLEDAVQCAEQKRREFHGEFAHD
jgi:hypothetical protein